MLTFTLVGAQIAQCRVPALAIVEAFDVLEDARTSLRPAAILLAIDQRHPQCAMSRIVPVPSRLMLGIILQSLSICRNAVAQYWLPRSE